MILRKTFCVTALFLSGVVNSAHACWEAEELESVLLRSLSEYRQLWRSGCRPGSSDMMCNAKLLGAKAMYNLLPQNTDPKGLESWAATDERCGTRTAAIYQSLAETLEAVFDGKHHLIVDPIKQLNKRIPISKQPERPVLPELTDEMRKEITVNVIDPCLTKAAESVTLPQDVSIEHVVRTIKERRSAEIDVIFGELRTLFRPHLSQRQRALAFNARREKCEKSAVAVVRTEFPYLAPEIATEIVVGAIDPCYEKVVKHKEYGLPKDQRNKQTIEDMKAFQRDEIEELTRTIGLALDQNMSPRERKRHYRSHRYGCAAFAFQNPLLPNRPNPNVPAIVLQSYLRW